MEQKKFIILIIFIAVIAALTGYYLYFSKSSPELRTTEQESKPLSFADLSQEEREIMEKGGAEAVGLAAKIAIPLSTLIFEKNCDTKISIIQAEAGGDFVIRNKNDSNIIFTMLGTSHTIPAGEEKIIRLPPDSQLTNYECKASLSASSHGVIFITEDF